MSTESTNLIQKNNRPGFYQDNISHSTDYRNSAVKLLIPEEEEEQDWIGLSNRELQPFIDDEFWVRIRKICCFVIWFFFSALLTGVVVFTVQAPRCRGLDWWQKGPVYNVLAQSYKDSDNSGYGDLRGIESKLDYIVSLGVKIIWLSPINKSPMKDFGYDIQNFKDIDEIFGNLDDFKHLLSAMKQRDMKLIMDFVPNHSSDEHEWFKKSIEREEPYTDYYVWSSPKGYKDDKPLPPNNWISVFGGSAWEWNEKRQQFYYHQFAKQQPDLNFRNRAVIEELKSVLKFWLDLGVSGFRVDSAPHLFEDSLLRDEPAANNSSSNFGEYNSLTHIYTQNLPEVKEVIAEFRQLLTDYSDSSDNIKRLMIVEVYNSIEETMTYYGNDETPLSDFPFNFIFVSTLSKNSTASDVKTAVESWLTNMPQNKWSNWVLGNHDNSRAATRFGADMVDALNMITLLLPGTAVTYYGEEIGMEDTPISWNDTVDPAGLNAGQENYAKHSRDPERTPMQWNAEKNSGFSIAEKTWLPVNPNYKTVNVAAQTKGDSHLSVYKSLVKARNEPAIMYGEVAIKVLDESVFAFTRIKRGALGYVIAVNWGNETKIANLSEFNQIPARAQVYTKSINFRAGDLKYVNTTKVALAPKEGIVLMFSPEVNDISVVTHS